MSPLHKKDAFTLIELVMAIAIMAMVSAFTIPAIKALGSSSQLNASGCAASNLFTAARQNSISNHVLTAVVVLTAPGSPRGGDAAYRVFTMLQIAQRPDGATPTTSDWRQVGKWEVLPMGVVIDSSSNASTGLTYSTFLTSPTVIPALPTLRYQDTSYTPGTGYAYQIFTPSGGLMNTTSSGNTTLVLAQGFYSGTTLTHTGGNNKFSFTFNNATGAAKITRQ